MATTAPETRTDVRGDGSGHTRLPSATGDFYDIAALLGEEDAEIVGRVREFGEKVVAPIINQYWARAEFPFELIPQIANLAALPSPAVSRQHHGVTAPARCSTDRRNG